MRSTPPLQEGLLIPSWGNSACFMGSPDVGEQVWRGEHQTSQTLSPRLLSFQMEMKLPFKVTGPSYMVSKLRTRGAKSELVCGAQHDGPPRTERRDEERGLTGLTRMSQHVVRPPGWLERALREVGGTAHRLQAWGGADASEGPCSFDDHILWSMPHHQHVMRPGK